MKNNFNPWEVFDEIECSHNPEYIVCVSHLRHYTNIFGIDKRLIDFLGMEKNTILDIETFCFGGMDVFGIKEKAIIYYFTQQNKSATAVIVVVVTNILI